jgi:putative phage-type endonuclease
VTAFSPEELARRRATYNASEIAAIVGLSAWRTPLDVAAEKLGQGAPREVNENMDRGTFLEPGLRDWYRKRTGKRVDVPGRMQGNNPLMAASPDGLVFGGSSRDELEAVLEIKVPGEFMSTGWGEDGSQQVPMDYLCQGAWQAAVADVPRIDFAALIRGRLHVYPVPRDREFEGMLIERVERFHVDYVSQGKLPPAQLPDLDWLKKKFPRAELDYITAGPEHQEMIAGFLAARTQRKAWERTEGIARAELELIIGTHAGLRFEGGRIDWRHTKDSDRTDWKAVATELRNAIALRASVAPDGGFEKQEFATLLGEYEETVKAKTRTQPGNRPFVPRLKAEWDET